MPQSISSAAEKFSLPLIRFPDELPITQYVNDIEQALVANPVIIVAGDTGSGKSTQLPKICLRAGFGLRGFIGHTQPRRIAARTLAERISEEMRCQLGEQVGYQFRFQQLVQPRSLIKLMTDGILLAELQHDRYLSHYDCIIIDEAHERSLNIDFLLGYLKSILPRRPDLRVIITSATIDTERFSQHFSHAPVIQVEGRSYPVEIRYCDNNGDDRGDNKQELALEERVLQVTRDIVENETRGDILVFLSGEAEIRQCQDILRKHLVQQAKADRYRILPLYARLSSKDQHKVFQSDSAQKIILATNVAETSITIPGIKYVIDSGLARISRYSSKSKVQLLPIEKVSQASANQRAGRCGRVSNGICYRLYSADDFEKRPLFSEPEIKRTNLAAVILAMEAAALGDIRKFPFIDAPENKYINDGYKLLHELAAVDVANHITPVGRQLARLPLDPRLAKIMVSAEQLQCLEEILVIISALALQDIRDKPLNKQAQAEQAHARFCHKQSDFLSYLSIWQEIEALQGRGLAKFCRQNYLSYLRVLEWLDIHDQLRRLAKKMKMALHSQAAGYNAIHRALLSGLISLVGVKETDNEYLGTRNTRFVIARSSCLAKKTPKWVMAESLIHTGRVYAYNVASVYPKWIEATAEHLIRRDYYDADWDKKRGRVSVYCRSMLYGLLLQSGRLMDYGRIDAVAAREIFIAKALVERQLGSGEAFYLHNRRLIQKYEKLEAKQRTRNIITNDAALFQFYDQRIPHYVCSVDSLRNWLKQVPDADGNLRLDASLLLTDAAKHLSESDYPDVITVRGHALPLSYVFEPGSEDDGVTVALPLYLLSVFTDADFDCLVPGMLQDKIVAMIKTLPKQIRTSLVPAVNFAQKLLPHINNERSLSEQLSELLQQHFNIMVPLQAWEVERLPLFYQMQFRIVDDANNPVAQARSLRALSKQLRKQVARESESQPGLAIELKNVTQWEQGMLPGDELPGDVNVKRGAHELVFYPAMCDNGHSVDIKLFPQRSQALVEHAGGVLRLFILSHAKKMKYLRKNIPELTTLSLLFSGLGNQAELKHALEQRILTQALFDSGEFFYRDQDISGKIAALYHLKEFLACLERADQVLLELMQDLSHLLLEILQLRQRVCQRLEQASQTSVPVTAAFSEHIRQQLDDLFATGFIQKCPLSALKRFPAYLNAILQRIERYSLSPSADADKQKQWQVFADRLQALAPAHQDSLAFSDCRWMLQEYRIALFAPQIKTAQPVSPKRLEQCLAALS